MLLARTTLTILFLALASGAYAERLRVAVAANFKPTLAALTPEFEAQTGHRVVLSSASSGVLATQLLKGAPFDVFFSADEHAPRRVQRERALPDTHLACYALGQLALTGDAPTLSQLSNPALSLAIANPATAPYGRAAMTVLARDEFASGGGRKLVRGNNAVQAYQFRHSGAVDLALVPLSLVLPPHADNPFIPVPAHWHTPIAQYSLVLTRSAAADAYMAWLRSDTVQAQLRNAGYLPCP